MFNRQWFHLCGMFPRFSALQLKRSSATQRGFVLVHSSPDEGLCQAPSKMYSVTLATSLILDVCLLLSISLRGYSDGILFVHSIVQEILTSVGLPI